MGNGVAKWTAACYNKVIEESDWLTIFIVLLLCALHIQILA
jgi:hypothetical protein